MGLTISRVMRIAASAVAFALIAACASPTRHAPVEERPPETRIPATPAAPAVVEVVKPPLPGIENAGKPGYYTVKPQDTLIRIGLDTGQNWRDLARWNNIDNPNLIEVGQVIRVVAPGVDPTLAAAHAVSPSKVESRALAPAAAASAAGTPVVPVVSPPAVGPIAAPLPPPQNAEDELNWAWPAAGPVIGAFDDTRSKGLSIGGKAGDPVLAAADGRVVYAGSGLRGYGNLIIIKHNNTYLTAYAHNQTLLVKEEQTVKRGQKIAEMGNSDADRVELHFEIRRQGKPIDPAKLLPPR